MTSDLLESGMELNRALPLVAEVLAARDPVLRRILGEFRAALRSDSFAATAARHLPETEALLFARFGDASDASILRAAARLSRVDERVARAIRQALAWPAFLFLLVFVLLYVLGRTLFPTVATLAPIREWPLLSQAVARTAIRVSENGPLAGAAILALYLGYKWVERNHAGPSRVWLDRLPPFSLHRLRLGAGFAFVLVENARVGHEINRAFLLRLANRLPPYARSRVLAIAAHADRTGLGQAATAAGQGFPDPELNAVLRAYAGQRDWVPRFARYADAWLERLQERIEAAVRVVRVALTVAAAGIIGAAAFVIVNIATFVD